MSAEMLSALSPLARRIYLAINEDHPAANSQERSVTGATAHCIAKFIEDTWVLAGQYDGLRAVAATLQTLASTLEQERARL